MSLLTPFIENLKSIEHRLPDIAKKAVIDNAGTIINLVKFGQLARGKNSQDLPLDWSGGSGFYAKGTQAFADRDGISIPKQWKAPYNFQWTGSTFDSMRLKIINQKEFDIFTTDGKQRLLESIYGEIFELNKKHNDWVNENIILPALELFILQNMVL